MNTHTISNRLTVPSLSEGALPDCANIPSWIRNVREPLLHSHGLHWSDRVLPNDFFFFTRWRIQQMISRGLSYVLHNRHELVVCYKGGSKACLGDEVFEFSPGMAKLVRPGQFHYYFDFQEEPFVWLIFSFKLSPKATLMAEGNAVFQISEEQLAQIGEATQQYISAPRHEESIHAIALQMANIIRSLNHRVDSIGKIDEEPFHLYNQFRHIAFYVNEHMEDVIRIHDLAHELGVSEGHLRKTFRELIGVSLGSWLRESRFGRGTKLIANSDLNISEIARLSGFENIHSFSQAFRKKVGMSPTAYRKNLMEGNETSIHPSTRENNLSKTLSKRASSRAKKTKIA